MKLPSKNGMSDSDQIIKEYTEINSDLEELEWQIVNFFGQSTSEYGRDPIMATIIGHFFLRRDLTQKELRKLTGYSTGAVSQALQELVEQGLVQEYKPEGRGAYHYTVENISSFLVRAFQQIAELYSSGESDFQEIQSELNKMPEDLHNEPLFRNIQTYVTTVLRFAKLYRQIWNFIKTEVNKLKEK